MELEFKIVDNELMCVYTPQSGFDYILDKIYNKGYKVKNTFFVQEKDLINIKEGSLHFIIGKKEEKYIKLNNDIFEVKNNFYFLSTIDFKEKLFVAPYRISIIKKLDKLITFDFYVGNEDEHNFEISFDLYLELLRQLPTSTELEHYSKNRISSILKEALPQIDKYEYIYKKYLSRKKQVSFIKNEEEEYSKNIEIELEQFTTALDELKELLNDKEHTEVYWQKKICSILQLIYPKYILCKREMQFRGIDNYDKKPDFVLVDANGYIDILEIKKPDTQILTKQSSYRNNYVPVKNLSGSIQQIEKYLVCLNKLDPDKNEFFSILQNSLPPNIKPIALNPQGILLLGRSNQFNDQQRHDFELIKRQYKHITDIMTYDDLVIRLENIIYSLKLRLKKD